VGAKLFHADRQTYMMKVIFTFCNNFFSASEMNDSWNLENIYIYIYKKEEEEKKRKNGGICSVIGIKDRYLPLIVL
jgi:hypothetical protein